MKRPHVPCKREARPSPISCKRKGCLMRKLSHETFSRSRILPGQSYYSDDMTGYSLIDIEADKKKALSSLNFTEFKMWEKIENGTD